MRDMMTHSLIYADNSATTKLDTDAFDVMKVCFFEEYGNASQPYSFSRPARKHLKDARETIAICLNALPDEVYFTSGGTESNNWATKGMIERDDERTTITSTIEHHSVLRSCSAIERLGFPVAYIQPNETGKIEPQTLQNVIDKKTKLVSVMMANNEIGTIQPIKELSSIAHEHGAVFHTDAVQAVGHIPIDVQELGIDLLSASAHKFNGPKGIGFLYIRKGTKLAPFMNGGSQESGMRAGTENVPFIVAMATALKNNCDYRDEYCKHVNRLSDILIYQLNASGLDFIRNGVDQLPGLLSLSFRGQNGETLLHCLDLMGICVSTGSACDSKATVISHVLQAIGLPDEYAKGTIRISLGKDNTESDIDAIVSALIKIMR